MQDSGRYSCEATNVAGKTEKNYNLNVWGELSLNFLSVGYSSPKNISVYTKNLVLNFIFIFSLIIIILKISKTQKRLKCLDVM